MVPRSAHAFVAAALAISGLECGGAGRDVAAPRVPRTQAPPPADAATPTAPARAAAYPVPPSQRAPWERPKSSLKPKLVDGIERLFDQGLADPRGLTYREVEITTGSVWSGEATTTKTRAWVLPARDDKSSFAVTWSGIVVRARTVGAPADVRADARKAIDDDDKARADYARQNPGSTFYRFRSAMPEAASASPETITPVHVAMLLRLGEAKLAEDMWRAWTGGMRSDTNDDARHLEDPYQMLATYWIWALFDRAVVAHMRGDGDAALQAARTLASVAHDVDEECARRGVQTHTQAPNEPAPKYQYLAYLDPLEALLADEERRALRTTPHPTVEDLRKLDPPQRVRALIEELDQVAARQWGQPGGVNLAEDPIVVALMELGADAVEPLIDVLEKDTRLTRSVHFWRDFSFHRGLLGVHEAAYVALSGILETSFFSAASTGDDLSARGMEGRKKVASQVRAYWSKWKGISREEKWYLQLADDHADPVRWLEVAGLIAQPTNVTISPSSMAFTYSASTSTPAGQKVSLRGESLRTKSGPSVSELLDRRVESLKGEPRHACAMATILARWDEHAAIAPLARQTARLVAAAASSPGHTSNGPCIAELTTARARAGDRTALAEYAAWVATITPEGDSYDFAETLAPLVAYPNDPDAARAARTLFADGSPWTPLIATKPQVNARSYRVADLLTSRLFVVPAFRAQAIKALSNNAPAGTLEIQERNGVRMKLDFGSQIGTSGDDKEPSMKPGTYTLRVADYAGWLLSRHDDLPKFRLQWEQPARDKALAALRAHLQALP